MTIRGSLLGSIGSVSPAVFLSLLVATATSGMARAQAADGFSGVWQLDEAHSDDPAEIVEKADHGGIVGRVLRSTSGSIVINGVPVPELPSSNERNKPRSHDSASLVKSGHVLSTIDKLTISRDNEAVELIYDTMRAATYEFGVAHETGYSTIVAEQSGDRLIVEHTLIGGAEITETYEVDGDRLVWKVRVKGDDIKTIRVSRVYQRAGSEPPAEAPANSRLELTAALSDR